MMPRILKIVITVIIFVILLFVIVWPFSPAGIQSRNLRTAETLIPTVESLLELDDRFAELKVGRYTGGGGGMQIIGWVKDQDVEDDLKEVISAMDIPVHVEYRLRYKSASPDETTESGTSATSD